MPAPRFSIARLMIAVALAGVLAWVVASVRNPYAIVASTACLAIYAGLATGPWATLRKARRQAAWVLGVSSVLAFVPLAGLGVFSIHYLSGVYKVMVGLIAMPFVFGAGIAWAHLASSPGYGRRPRPILAWAVVASLFALPVSMIFSDWPMRAAFAASRPALDRLANRLASGEELARPEWAGLFLVRKARPNLPPGTVALVVENDSTGHTWLVRGESPDVAPAITRPIYSVAHDTTQILRHGRWWRYEYD